MKSGPSKSFVAPGQVQKEMVAEEHCYHLCSPDLNVQSKQEVKNREEKLKIRVKGNVAAAKSSKKIDVPEVLSIVMFEYRGTVWLSWENCSKIIYHHSHMIKESRPIGNQYYKHTNTRLSFRHTPRKHTQGNLTHIRKELLYKLAGG